MQLNEKIPSTLASKTGETLSTRSESTYRSLLDSVIEHGIVALSSSGRIVTWNAGARRLFGYRADEMVGQRFTLLFPADDPSVGWFGDACARARGGEAVVAQWWCERKDGSRVWCSVAVSPLLDEDGTFLGLRSLVSELLASHAAAEPEPSCLVDDDAALPVFSLTNDGSIVTWNEAAKTTFGYSERDIVGANFARLFTAEDTANGVPAIVLRKASMLGGVDEERWFVRKDGSRFLGAETISAVIPGAPGHVRCVVRIAQDLGERKKVTSELRRRASLDGLTELPNRATFFEHVRRAIGAMKTDPARSFAVLFIDLDHFKQINDTFGHGTADRLLEITARRLERCVRQEDVVARIGGDEFAILISAVERVTDTQDAADRIRAEMRKPIRIDTRTVQVTVSVGIAIANSRYETPEDVLSDADTAMYVAKTDGRARSAIFTDDLRSAAQRRFDLGFDLQHAVERDELRVVFQPIVRLADFAIGGFEALVRWQHHERGLLLPAEFLASAEASGAIVAIDRWVLREACQTLAAWQAEPGWAELSVSVNMSAKTLADAASVEQLHAIVHATGVASRCVCIEASEATMLAIGQRDPALFAAIRAFGFELAIDDFGARYASLAALAQLPVQTLKLDRSFIAALSLRNGAEVVRAVAQLAQSLGRRAVAKGIETREQFDELTALGSAHGQGTFTSPPLDAAAVFGLLERHSSAGGNRSTTT